MADVHNRQTRSYNMSRIKGKNTKPEMYIVENVPGMKKFNVVIQAMKYFNNFKNVYRETPITVEIC